MALDTFSVRMLSASAREFWINVQIDVPVSQSYDLCSKSPFEFEIVEVHHKTITGTVSATYRISNGVVDFADGQSDYSIVADAGATDDFLPLSSVASNYTVQANQNLTVTLDPSSDGTGYIACVHCRRTRNEA